MRVDDLKSIELVWNQQDKALYCIYCTLQHIPLKWIVALLWSSSTTDWTRSVKFTCILLYYDSCFLHHRFEWCISSRIKVRESSLACSGLHFSMNRYSLQFHLTSPMSFLIACFYSQLPTFQLASTYVSIAIGSVHHMGNLGFVLWTNKIFGCFNTQYSQLHTKHVDYIMYPK